MPDSTPVNDRTTVSIREDAKGRIILTGLHQVNINSFEELIGALNFGSAIRQTDSTAINAKSSRSHAVFSLNLVQRKAPAQPSSPKEKRMSMPVDSFSSDSVTVDSKLHFVDLAGSERLKNTGASGERAKEGISINAGLAALGKVISQLSSRQSGSHVSYRDSKLTRLLQDSLGGNAITYMIACVTPAEFHLSETLNTIQYAQRARAIQSKPRIQQIADDGDKHALIERLKAEVAFLRQQIRNSEGPDRREAVSTERSDRKNERVIQLQNQLLDAQESYNALSQRHTKLISHLANDSETANGDTDDATADVGKSSIERMQRSRSFAESVEQVVLEYEKTIQSLEASLSDTRSSLATTESTLLERETKCTYVETVNAQLQSRVQKLLDRETSTETYLHELEAKVSGADTGEEQHDAIVAELRKEINRARENEASCEDYISTLEDRLAESDQDMELMQREVVRLEHVIQRQRGLGTLDNLLHDLDHRRKHGEPQHDGTNGIGSGYAPVTAKHHRHTPSLDVLNEAAETAIPESDEDLNEPIPEEEEDESFVADIQRSQLPADDLSVLENMTYKLEARRSEALREEPLSSPAQSRFVADKLETVTQELFDLRLQHETVASEYETLESKYEEAMKALASLRQDKADEARHPAPALQNDLSRPVSFLGDGGAPSSKPGVQHSLSQSLSSELSSAVDSPTLREASEVSKLEDDEPITPVTSTATVQQDNEELERVRKMLAEHEEGASLMSQKYTELQTEHEEILGIVDKLKAEAETQRSKASPPPTPSFKMIRRMTSQNLLSGTDRAHRSLAALRMIANEELVDKPDTIQIFEGHIDTTIHELATRIERLQTLEAENQNVKKEMDMKATIISGLTRERSSLQGASSVDMALVNQLRDQVVAQENQLNELREAHDARERALMAEIENLNALLQTQEVATKAMDAGAEEQDKRIDVLEGELTAWKGKHQTALGSLQSSEKQLAETLAELDGALASVETMRSARASSVDVSTDKEAAAKELETGRAKQQGLVEGFEKDIEEHKATIALQLATIAGLEKSRSDAQEQLSQQAGKEVTREVGDADAARVFALEQEISAHRSTIDAHKTDLELLQDTHKKELAELEERTKAAAQAEHESRLADKDTQYDQSMAALQNDIAESRDELVKLLKSVSTLLNSDVTAETLADQIQDVMAQKQHFSDKYAELMDTNEGLRKQIDANGDQNTDMEELTKKSTVQEAKVNELALLVATLEDALRQKDEQVKKKEALVDEITAEKEKSVRLVEELEEQITSSFDQHHNRLSVIQQERDQSLEDAKARIVVLENEIETYTVRIEQLEVCLYNSPLRFRAPTNDNQLQLKNSGTQDGSHDRSSSMTSNLRKSSSAASLPSPPPAIPLPPLPTIASQSNGTNSVSPPSSRHASKELVNAQLVEDQESRIRTIEKHLYAEKQLTATLEEALGDLETQSSKVKTDCEAWKKKAWGLEDELSGLRKERNSARLSLQAVEEERSARREAEAARAQLEERMNALNKKKKKSTLNCF